MHGRCNKIAGFQNCYTLDMVYVFFFMIFNKREINIKCVVLWARACIFPVKGEMIKFAHLLSDSSSGSLSEVTS